MDDVLERPDYVGELERLAEFERRLLDMLAAVRGDRARAVRVALAAGVPGAAVMKATGLSHARVYQLRAGHGAR
jgi:hypothetical protein